MPEYRRSYVPGGSYFLTLLTYNRTPLFQAPENISRIREAIKMVKSEMPFDILGAVTLPDHLHFIWTLPPDDVGVSNSRRSIEGAVYQNASYKSAARNSPSKITTQTTRKRRLAATVLGTRPAR